MRKMNRTAIAVVLILLIAVLAGCGASGGKSEPKPDADFLMGSWFAKTATKYFSDDGKCTMAIDQQRALLTWELTDNGVTLKGDDTYPGTFTDESRTSMILVVQGVDVLMEKFEE